MIYAIKRGLITGAALLVLISTMRLGWRLGKMLYEHYPWLLDSL